jgi:hypothetical protein
MKGNKQARGVRGMANKDEFLRIVKTGSGGHIAFAVNAIAPNTTLLPEKVQEHLIAVDYYDKEADGLAKIYLYLDSGVYIKIIVEYDKETKQITKAEVDFDHLSECYCD